MKEWEMFSSLNCTWACEINRGSSFHLDCQRTSPTWWWWWCLNLFHLSRSPHGRMQGWVNGERRREGEAGNTKLLSQRVKEVSFYTFITTCNHIKLTFLSKENRKVSETVAIKRWPPPPSSLCATLIKTHELRIKELQWQTDERRRRFAVKTRETGSEQTEGDVTASAGILTLNCKSATFSQYYTAYQ